jgi:hypothetical protein
MIIALHAYTNRCTITQGMSSICFCGCPVSATRRKYCSYPCQALGARLTVYGIDGALFRELLQRQPGVCAICAKPLIISFEVRAPSIDHDHRTGRVRGILCQSCNLRVGWYEQAMKNDSMVAAQQLDGFAIKIARHLGLAAQGAFGPR